MNLLVTGGAGFIGSHLCELLIAENHKVIVIDDLSTGKTFNLRNVKNKITFFNQKLETFDFKKFCEIDGIIHLAAQASVPLSITNFFDSSMSNIYGTLSVIDHCQKNNIPLVFASSSAVYGDLEYGNDEVEKTNLNSPYAIDKFAMELYSKVMGKISKFSNIGLRFFNVYGPRQDPNSPYSGVISIFVSQILKNNHIIINGGTQTRDFIFVKDVAQSILKAIELCQNKYISTSVNILTGRSYTIEDLAKLIMKKTGNFVKKKYEPFQIGDPMMSSGSIKKMEKLLGVDCSNFIKLELGLDETINYIKMSK